MNYNKTASILQRLPRILAVTAASYGLTLNTQGRRISSRAVHPAGATTGKQGKPR